MPDANIDIADINIKDVVKEKYGQAALRVTNKTGGSGCCGAAPADGLSCDPITSSLYDESQAQQIPEEAMLASLGCGNPSALAQLSPGETVLDLGSGGGIDVLLLRQARRAKRQSLRPRHDGSHECLCASGETQTGAAGVLWSAVL